MANKSKKTPERIEAVLENLRHGMSREASCTQAGITRPTLYRWCEEDEELAQRVEEACDFSEAVLLAELKSQGRERSDWRATAWILERRFPDRWGIKRDTEITINKSDGSDVVVSMVQQAQAMLAEMNDDDE